MTSSVSAKAYRQYLKEHGVFHTDEKLAEIIKSYGKDKPRDVYDPTCGVGTLLSVFDDAVPKYGQELNGEYLAMAEEALVNFTGVVGDTLKEPAFMDKRFDLIVANYPFSVKWDEEKDDVRFREFSVVPPKSKADYAFIMHMLYLLDEDGVCVTLNFPGILYRKAREGKIREELVKKGYIKKVVRVPGGYFEDTAIETALFVLSKSPSDGYITFEDLTLSLSRKVPLSEVEDHDYVLSVNQYVWEEEEKEEIDIDALNREVRAGTVRSVRASLKNDFIVAQLAYSISGRLDDLHGFMTSCKEVRGVADEFMAEARQFLGQ